ncbi:MAG TPA: phosphatidylglycerophosphatase A [Pirellulales bacterium]|jgi:phosphatidylglycerophosphatase A
MGGGIGLMPVAPGTWGSLLGLPLARGIGLLPNPWLQGAALATMALAGVLICALAVRQLGGPHDPGFIVFDEIVGMAATLFLVDATRPINLLLGFALFRLFDVLKPSPAREVERLPHGWGIMADDLVAAVYASLSLRLLLWLGSSTWAL